MAVDTTIQFNGHNSYKVTELLLAYPFGVQGMTYITHSFQVYCNSPLASATRAKTKFFDADGATLSEASHAFAVPAVFEKIEITVPVPATAVQAQLVFLHGGTDWWFAEPKSEEGQSATPYNVNYAGQLTYITPNGIYTGMVTANQIVVTGSIAQPDETLETRLVTINNGVINLSSTLSAKTTKITNEGVYTGEVVASQITAGYISVDRLSAKSITGAKLADGTVDTLQIAASAITADKIAAGTITANEIASSAITADKIDVSDLAVGKIINLDDADNFVVLVNSISGQDFTFYSALSGYDPAKRGMIQTLGSTAFLISAPVKAPLAGGAADGVSSLGVYHGNSGLMISDTSVLATCRLQCGDNQLGVDSTGVFKVISGGAKQYL